MRHTPCSSAVPTMPMCPTPVGCFSGWPLPAGKYVDPGGKIHSCTGIGCGGVISGLECTPRGYPGCSIMGAIKTLNLAINVTFNTKVSSCSLLGPCCLPPPAGTLLPGTVYLPVC